MPFDINLLKSKWLKLYRTGINLLILWKGRRLSFENVNLVPIKVLRN